VSLRKLLGTLIVLGSFFIGSVTACGADKEEILRQINEVREERGLSPYELSEDFCRYADIRAGEQEKCFSHTRPDGRRWYTVSPSVYRENIAHIENSEQEKYLITAWMESDSHRANVLSKESRKIGIGIYETDGEQYVVTLTD